MNSRSLLGMMVVAAALSGCSRPPRVSDTGYVGTWARGTERARSTIAIVKDGDIYRFRWTGTSDDGKWRVTCDWDGSCQEIENEEKVASYAIGCHMDPESGRLLVKLARTGTPKSPDSQTHLDELVIDPGGLVLRSFTIEHEDRHYEPGKGPTRVFDKVSDAVVDPPSTRKN